MISVRMIKLGNRKEGVAVAVVMFMLLLIASFTAAVGLLTKQNYTNSAYNEKILTAKYMARAGMAVALDKLTEDTAWSATEAAPHREMMDAANVNGFEVWLDAINTSSHTPIASSDGTMLAKGRAVIKVNPIVGNEVMTGAMAGAEQSVLLVKPPMIFDDAILSFESGVALALGAPGRILSYNSASGPPAIGANPIISPVNTTATIRSMGDISLGAVQVYGSALLPSAASFSTGSGTLSGGAPIRLNESYLLPKVEGPHDTLDLATTANPDALGNLAPGVYDDLIFPAGTHLKLQRGGVYVFWDAFHLGDNSSVEIVGPASDGPVQLYTHEFASGKNSKINMPVDPATTAPVPADFQVYGVSMVGCTLSLVEIGNGTDAALVSAVPTGTFKYGANTRIFGGVIAKEISRGLNSEIHYDLSLRGADLEANVSWSLVGQGRN